LATRPTQPEKRVRAPGIDREGITFTHRTASRRLRAAGAATAALALFTASIAPLPDPATPPGLQAPPTTVGAALDDRAFSFLLSDHERDRRERDVVDQATRDHRVPAKPKAKKTTRPRVVQQHRKPRPKVRPRPARPRQVAPAGINSARARIVINFALAQVGKPYRWASAGPGSYDCSGLVKASFARVGLRLPHQTGQLVRRGRPVSRSALKPGDIVFPSSGHVGIYLGRGRMVHAPKPGDHVRVAPLYGFWTARRLL
jgi:cell wall-associated NlpC family hydrolase